jgi:hypothetical protein
VCFWGNADQKTQQKKALIYLLIAAENLARLAVAGKSGVVLLDALAWAESEMWVMIVE